MTARWLLLGTTRLGLWILLIAVLLFLIFPLVVVVPESFSPTAILAFPPTGFSLRWYQDFFGDPNWLQALWLSIKLGLAVAVVATLLGLGAAVAVRPLRDLRQQDAIRALVLAPLIVPVIVTAIALFEIMTRLDLVGSFLGLLLCHTVLALPFPVFHPGERPELGRSQLEDAAVEAWVRSRLLAFCKITGIG